VILGGAHIAGQKQELLRGCIEDEDAAKRLDNGRLREKWGKRGNGHPGVRGRKS